MANDRRATPNGGNHAALVMNGGRPVAGAGVRNLTSDDLVATMRALLAAVIGAGT